MEKFLKKPLIIPFFIPHAGCPFICVFCNQWKISGAEEAVRPEKIGSVVTEYLKRARQWPGRHVEIAFYGGSFTALPQEVQTAYLQAAAELKSKGLINGLRLSTRPDFITEEIVERLLAYGVTTVELGVQSLADEVLAQTCRGHTAEDARNALLLLRRYPLAVGYQLMLGLPGDNPAFARLTLKKAVQDAPDFVRIYPTLVLKGTTLAKWYQEKKYRPWDLELAVETAAEWLGTFAFYQIPVIRLGLQAADNFTRDKDLLAGPYHPAFGELVESRLFLRQIEMGVEALSQKEDQLMQISFHPAAQSKVLGQKKSNADYLRRKYHFSAFQFTCDAQLAEDDLIISTAFQSIPLRRKEFLKKYRIEDIGQ
jgi:histone acetyltransferase (RNA polymerase elongator complex component)